MSRKVLVLDTTLRDGEQVPGAKLNLYEKLEIAAQLKALNVDIIEAGFSASSEGDFKAVQAIARNNGDGPVITALARAVKNDIWRVYESVKDAERPMIHIVLGTSNIHLEKKFHKTRQQVLEQGVEAVKYARSLLPQVQYSTEDASRSDFEYLWETIEAVVRAGATMINIPDTVGWAVPEEFGELVARVKRQLVELDDRVILSVHCHNDLGMATSNTLAAVKNGADKVECTVNGIGERAGNAALEEVVMGVKMRPEYYGAHTDVATREIKRTSRLVSSLMGLEVQVNKAVTGDNAFAHSSGIHQDGLLKSRDVYEIIDPAEVGVEDMELVLTARSGKHALKNALERLGWKRFGEEDFEDLFRDFLELADRKKEVYNHDLFFLIKQHFGEQGLEAAEGAADLSHQLFELEAFQVVSNDIFPSATVKIRRDGQSLRESAVGEGPVDALYTAIKNAVGMDIRLEEYRINSMSRGKEALGRVTLNLSFAGKNYTARAVDTDVVKASALAFINGINEIVVDTVVNGKEKNKEIRV